MNEQLLDLLTAASGSSGGGKLYVEDVFSTYLYTGNGSTQTITNGINLSGKGGMVWVKNRTSAIVHGLYDTSRGAGIALSSNTTGGNNPGSSQTFSSTGFAFGNGASMYNASSDNYAAWTFREAPKFFDVVTYTGNGSARTIAHNLGVAPGCIIVKRTDTTSNWAVYHRGYTSASYYTILNSNGGVISDSAVWNGTAPTASVFSVGTSTGTNANGGTYVAYLFAHDNGADGLIQCGSYTGNGNATGPTISLGWEPQWLLIKDASGIGGNWMLLDSMRGMPVGAADAALRANDAAVESSSDYVSPMATGFQPVGVSADVNTSGMTYTYVAIRRGPMKTPTSGTSVFAPVAYSGTSSPQKLTSGFPVDTTLFIGRNSTGASALTSYSWPLFTRLLSIDNAFETASSDSWGGGWGSSYLTIDNNFGTQLTSSAGYFNASGGTFVNYGFRRAPGFFDVVCYTGTGVARTISHNLGVAPELIIYKNRSATGAWMTYCAQLTAPNDKYLLLNQTAASGTVSGTWKTPTSTTFGMDISFSEINQSGNTYVAYLFASCPGVSKVGSYTGNGSSQTINCGFAAGARFVMIKRTDSTGDWYVWDTARGMVAANDPHLSLNTTAAEVTTDDSVDTDNTGFIVNQVAATNVNVNGATYIYLAIA